MFVQIRLDGLHDTVSGFRTQGYFGQAGEMIALFLSGNIIRESSDQLELLVETGAKPAHEQMRSYGQTLTEVQFAVERLRNQVSCLSAC